MVRLSYDINKKKAWLKFADKLLEIIFYMLKYRLNFQEALKYTLKNKKRELQNLIEALAKPLTPENKENFFNNLVKAKHLIKNIVAYQNTVAELEGDATELCHEEEVLKEVYSLIYSFKDPKVLETFYNNLNLLIGAENLSDTFKKPLQSLLGGLKNAG